MANKHIKIARENFEQKIRNSKKRGGRKRNSDREYRFFNCDDCGSYKAINPRCFKCQLM